jgi:hypothetical protein
MLSLRWQGIFLFEICPKTISDWFHGHLKKGWAQMFCGNIRLQYKILNIVAKFKKIPNFSRVLYSPSQVNFVTVEKKLGDENLMPRTFKESSIATPTHNVYFLCTNVSLKWKFWRNIYPPLISWSTAVKFTYGEKREITFHIC